MWCMHQLRRSTQQIPFVRSCRFVTLFHYQLFLTPWHDWCTAIIFTKPKIFDFSGTVHLLLSFCLKRKCNFIPLRHRLLPLGIHGRNSSRLQHQKCNNNSNRLIRNHNRNCTEPLFSCCVARLMHSTVCLAHTQHALLLYTCACTMRVCRIRFMNAFTTWNVELIPIARIFRNISLEDF